MKTIAIANHKGGVGKTASTHALGTGLAQLGHRVLIVDIDPQSSLTNACDVEMSNESMAEVIGGVQEGSLSLADILIDVSDVEDATLHLAPADIALSPNELGLVQRMSREYLLRAALDTVQEGYDVCLIDCPPSLGLLTVNALAAADAAIIPTQPQMSDIRGLNLFLDTIKGIRQQINPSLYVLGILITFYDGRTILHKDAVEVLRTQGLPIFKTLIGRSIRVAESSGAGESILTYDPDNPQSKNYKNLAKEVDQWLRNGQR